MIYTKYYLVDDFISFAQIAMIIIKIQLIYCLTFLKALLMRNDLKTLSKYYSTNIALITLILET
jgi:hypothetical protein